MNTPLSVTHAEYRYSRSMCTGRGKYILFIICVSFGKQHVLSAEVDKHHLSKTSSARVSEHLNQHTPYIAVYGYTQLISNATCRCP